MSDIDFEKAKLAEYVCNAIKNATRKKELEDICEWFEDAGCDILGIESTETFVRRRCRYNAEDDSSAEREKQIGRFLENAVRIWQKALRKNKLPASEKVAKKLCAETGRAVRSRLVEHGHRSGKACRTRQRPEPENVFFVPVQRAGKQKEQASAPERYSGLQRLVRR